MRVAVGVVAGLLIAALAQPAVALQPDDPRFPEQYGLTQISAPAAWDGASGHGVIIAVVDTGADLGHPDLAANLVPGHNVLDPTLPPADDHGHGTHVGGIAAAATNNRVGVAGTAFSARIMPVKVLDEDGRGSSAGVSRGIRWALDHGATVINLSLGDEIPFDEDLVGLQADFDEAARRGAVVVAAAGNRPLPVSGYAGASNVIVVGATDRDDYIAFFSAWGIDVTLFAPGDEILSTTPTYAVTMSAEQPPLPRDYGTLSGTSMATPFVSGVVAMMLGLGARPDTVKDILVETADTTQDGAPRVNAARAVARVAPAPAATTTPPTAPPSSDTTRPQDPPPGEPPPPATPATGPGPSMPPPPPAPEPGQAPAPPPPGPAGSIPAVSDAPGQPAPELPTAPPPPSPVTDVSGVPRSIPTTSTASAVAAPAAPGSRPGSRDDGIPTALVAGGVVGLLSVAAAFVVWATRPRVPGAHAPNPPG